MESRVHRSLDASALSPHALLPNGKVFYSGSSTTSRLFDPNAHTWTTVATTIYSGTRTYGTSVLLPLTPANNYDPQVIIMGGGSPATKTTEIIDLGAATPSWRAGPSMSQARIEMNAVILPTGKVLALGGSVNDEDAGTKSLNADLYDPVSDSFSSAGANAYARLYHSVALLLPDATVWVAGGNPVRGSVRAAHGDLQARVPVQLQRGASHAADHYQRSERDLLERSLYGFHSRCGEYFFGGAGAARHADTRI